VAFFVFVFIATDFKDLHCRIVHPGNGLIQIINDNQFGELIKKKCGKISKGIQWTWLFGQIG